MTGGYTDRRLKCIDCGAEFVWTAGAQLFYAGKNFQSEPKCCKSCKAGRKQGLAGWMSPGRGHGLSPSVQCTNCGRDAKVPFVPAPGRPVFCQECFQQRRAASLQFTNRAH
jgi:CxxC-x17-CxxC domain-containing protein